MIITSIHGEKILKYLAINLDPLPTAGIIGISGENESGKSTIGEVICFALFGRTFSLEPHNIKKIIHWGESYCAVTINFLQGKEHYRLARFMDNDGNQSAKLIHLANGMAFAIGVDAVTTAINHLLGYEFDDFINSFYLAQREITAPHPRSETVKIMAGIAPLELALKKIQQEILQEEQEIAVIEPKIMEINTELKDLAVDKSKLKLLRKNYTNNNDILSELRRQVKGLKQANYSYKETLPVIRLNKTLLKITRWLVKILLFITIILSSTWLLLNQWPEHAISQWLNFNLTMLIPSWNKYQYDYLQWIVFGSIGTALWLLIFSGLGNILRQRIQLLENERINLAVKIRKIYLNANVYRSLESNIAALEYPPEDEVDRTVRMIIDNMATGLQTENIVNRTVAWLNILINQYEQALCSIDTTIIREEEKYRKAEHLEELHTQFETSIKEYSHRIMVRQLATELLHGACNRVAQRFNREVRDLVGATLPLFTDGRYQYLRIDENLNVCIFSKEKHDFMELDEVSSGTQRQTMLALRLTLARQLSERTKGVPQFLFLDEPFAFFDETRTRQSLTVLPALNPNLQQLFIVAQSFPEEVRAQFAIHIACIRDKLNLSA